MTLLYFFLNQNFNKNINNGKKDYSYSKMPDYYLKTFNHNKRFFENSFIVCQEEEKGEFDNYITVEEIIETQDFKLLNSLINDNWSRYREDFFLYFTFLRLIFICIAIKLKGLTNVMHVEADNLVYSNQHEVFNKVFSAGEFGYSLVSPMAAAPGIIFFKDVKAAENFLNLIKKLLQKGESSIIKATGVPFNYITDMNFMFLMYMYNKNFKMLPCTPQGKYSENLEKFNILFDPAGFGQYLGGTNNGHSAKFIDNTHFVSSCLRDKNFKLKFENSPYISFNNKDIPLYNLHIHNKKVIDNFLYVK